MTREQEMKQAGQTSRKFYDVVVIGSGPAGAVAAWTAAMKGQSVLILEAGKHFQSQDFPKSELHMATDLMWNAGMQLTEDGDIALLRAQCVGGGSVVNQCLLDPFSQDVWEHWHQQTGFDWLNHSDLSHLYQTIEKQLAIEEIQESTWNQNARIYHHALKNKNIHVTSVRRGQSCCHQQQADDCILCLGGCPKNSKQSMLTSFIPKALAKGAELVSETRVTQIVPSTSHVALICRTKNIRYTLYANTCVLAAGSLGTVQLLLKSGLQSKIPSIGHGFYCHPQIMIVAKFPTIVDSFKGAFQSLKSQDSRLRQQSFKLENVFAGPASIATLLGQEPHEHTQIMASYRYLAGMEAAIIDQTPGRMLLNQDRVKVEKPLQNLDRLVMQKASALISEMFYDEGASHVYISPFAIGLHLMGGCSLGQCLDDQFRLKQHQNIIVCDGSIFPSAPGINPSLSIMALAHFAMNTNLKHDHITPQTQIPRKESTKHSISLHKDKSYSKASLDALV